MGLAEIAAKRNKQNDSVICRKGITDLVIKRIPFTSPRLNYITYGGVPRGRMTMFAGKESSGKTTTALDLVKNAQILFKQEYEEEVSELTKKQKELSQIIADKNAKKGEKDRAKKELPEVEERLAYLKKRGVLQVVYFDAEGTIDRDWASKLGVDIENLWLFSLHTQTAEQFLDQVMEVVRDTDEVGLVIIDSIAVLVPQIVHGESFEQKNMGGNAKVVTDFCNEVCPILGKKNIACVVINQMRDNIGNPYGDFIIPCGNGLKLACSVIMTFQKGKLLDAAGNEQKNSFETPQGNLVWTRIQKTKCFKPDRRVGFYSLSYEYGVDVVADVIPMAVDFGVLEKSGAWFKILNPMNGEYLTYEDGEVIKIQGMANVVQFLRDNKEVYEFINNYVMAKVNGTDVLAIDEETDRQAIETSNKIESGIDVREETTEPLAEIPMDEGATV